MKTIAEQWKKLPSIIRTIVIFFLLTRCVLLIIGTISYSFIQGNGDNKVVVVDALDKPIPLKIWAVSDADWYMSIAKSGYSKVTDFSHNTPTNLGFFPLYPVTIFIAHFLFLKNNYLVAALLASNTAFIFSAYFLYKLVKIDYSENIALWSARFLFLFPASFIFSGVQTESLFLLLSLLSIYNAKKKRFLISGMFGFLATLTRPTGLLLMLPLAIIFFRRSGQEITKQKVLQFFSLMLIPSALVFFGLYTYFHNHDFFAYQHMQQHSWHHYYANPFKIIYHALFHATLSDHINAFVIVVFSIFIFCYRKKLPIEYILYSFAIILFAPITGIVIDSMRYALAAFPLFIALASVSESPEILYTVAMPLLMLQGFLMVFWVNNFAFIS